ncbi:uncharacterized protein LOC144149392 [Haemaphysalis longicornis]
MLRRLVRSAFVLFQVTVTPNAAADEKLLSSCTVSVCGDDCNTSYNLGNVTVCEGPNCACNTNHPNSGGTMRGPSQLITALIVLTTVVTIPALDHGMLVLSSYVPTCLASSPVSLGWAHESQPSRSPSLPLSWASSLHCSRGQSANHSVSAKTSPTCVQFNSFYR